MEKMSPQQDEIERAVESLPVFGVGTILEDRDALAFFHYAKSKLPYLSDELKAQAERLVIETEEKLEMDSQDEVIINENIIKGIVSLALKVGAAQALFDAGRTQYEIQNLRTQLQLNNPPAN